MNTLKRENFNSLISNKNEKILVKFIVKFIIKFIVKFIVKFIPKGYTFHVMLSSALKYNFYKTVL